MYEQKHMAGMCVFHSRVCVCVSVCVYVCVLNVYSCGRSLYVRAEAHGRYVW
jgi:hypothetical protein